MLKNKVDKVINGCATAGLAVVFIALWLGGVYCVTRVASCAWSGS